jgi:5-hydroxyisourate hydrolase-like protein (transthyretin family)
VWLAVLPSVAFSQSRVARVYDLEYPGIHHVNVDGRVVATGGAPLADVRVWLEPHRGLNGTVYRETLTDSQGRFSFADVNSAEALTGVVDPSPEWIPATFELARAGGGEYHAGDVRLALNTTLRVAVETAPGIFFKGDPEKVEPGNVNVSLMSQGGVSSAPPQFYADGVFTFDCITFREGELAVRFRDKYYRAKLHLVPGQRDRFVVARIPKEDNEDEKLELLEMLRPVEPAPPRVREGVVRAPDGTPVEGAIVAVLGEIGFAGIGRTSVATTGPDGHFRLAEPHGKVVESVGLVSADSLVSEEKEAGDFRGDITLANAVLLELGAGVPQRSAATPLRVRWWHDGLGWQTLDRLKTWVVLGDKEHPDEHYAMLVADLPGYFPIAVRLKLPETGGAGSPPLEHTFRFTDSPVRALQVRSAGKPLAGATVDLFRVDDTDDLPTNPLATYTTGADGSLRLAGAAKGIYEVFVYARGCAPAHAIWNPGAPLTVTLAAANGVLQVEGAFRGQVSVMPAGRSTPVAVAPAAQTGASFTLAPGEYEVAEVDDSGNRAGASHVTVTSGSAARVSLTAQPPAQIRVEFPDRERRWEVAALRLAAGSGMHLPWGPSESQTVRVKTRDQSATLQLRESGQYRIELFGRRGGGLIAARTITVVNGRDVVLRAPAETASLTGTARNFAPGAGRKAVQLWLHAADEGGWDVGVNSVDLQPDGTFRVDGLPPGRYYAWQQVFTSTDPESPGPYVDASPKHTWGGVAVVLEAGRATELKEPAAMPAGTVTLHIVDAAGKPVPQATVFIDDADDLAAVGSFQPPFIAVANGIAKVPDVRAGWLELELLMNTGRVYSVAGAVQPSSPLEIRLPQDGR